MLVVMNDKNEVVIQPQDWVGSIQAAMGFVGNLVAPSLPYSANGLTLREVTHAALADYQNHGEPRLVNDEWHHPSVDKPLQEAKSDALAMLAAKRHGIETGGVIVEGKFYSTDRDSQAAIARVSGTVAWKCNATVKRDIEQPDGSTVSTVCVSAAEFVSSDMDAVKAAVANHVAAAYAREAELMAAINAADSVSALRAIDLTAGWSAVPTTDPGA